MRRAATTVLDIELPIIIPARGTTVRPSTGKTSRPKITARLTAALAPIAANASPRIDGTSGARCRIVIAANPIIATTHTHARATGESGSTTNFIAEPTATSCAIARADDQTIDGPRPSR